MPTLELSLFGLPQIYMDGAEAATFNTRKDLALLAYLAVTGVAHSRDHLAGLLWSELSTDKALRNLRHSLYHVRKVLGPAWLYAKADVALTRQLPWKVDVHILHDAVNHFASIPTAMRNGQQVDALRQAINLYRGEFLQGFYIQKANQFEEWVVTQREASHLLVLRGLELAAHHALAHGEYAAGLAATRHWLQLEAWSESGYRLQMQLLARSGRRADALAQYETCRQILATELGVEPMSDTTALYQQIQAGTYPTESNHTQAHDTAVPVHGRGMSLPPAPRQQPANHVASESLPIPHRARTQAQRWSTAQPHLWQAEEATPPRRGAGEEQNTQLPNNLIMPLAGFIGRQSELTFASERLHAADCRLLTIAGPGGMGKTALALRVGQHLLTTHSAHFADGIFWVPLLDTNAADTVYAETAANTAPVGDAAAGKAILRAIIEKIGQHFQVRLTTAAQLHAFLRPRRLLLILDNFEHLLEGIPAIIELLTQAPHLKVLVTSRARLNARGETVLTLDKLSLPRTSTPANPSPATGGAIRLSQAPTVKAHAWHASEAVAMFVQRAQQRDPRFTVDAETAAPVAQICHLVEGLPLGIELAVSMMPLLSCQELVAELTASLDFLETDLRDIPPGQCTLRSVFERSWRLLSPDAQKVLARLAVFPGSFHRDAAVRIAGASHVLLRRLIDQSLVSKIGEGRFILHRTVHAFARQKLQQWPAENEALQRHFVHFYLEFLANQEAALTGATCGTALETIRADLENIHTAWRWAVAHRMYDELNRCLNALFLFYEEQSFYLDAVDLFEQALSSCLPIYAQQQETASLEITLLVGHLHRCLGLWYLRIGRVQKAFTAYESGWEILQHAKDPAAAILCLLMWGKSIVWYDVLRAKELLARAQRLMRTNHVVWLQSLAYQIYGESNILFGNYDEATAQIAEAYRLSQQIGWLRGLIVCHKALGRIHLARGRYGEAEEQLRAGLALARQYQLLLLWLESMTILGEALGLQGRFEEAQSCFAQAHKLAESMGVPIFHAPILWEEGCLAERQGDCATARARLRESLALGLPNWWAHALPTLGWVLVSLGEIDAAQRHFQEKQAEADAQERLSVRLDARAGLAYIAGLRADTEPLPPAEQERTLARAADVLQQIHQHPSTTQQTRDRITRITDQWAIPAWNAVRASG